ncbi:MAG TPA: hypothetical protein V6D17_10120 [Candidatus Obscuribacterales bacterium]
MVTDGSDDRIITAAEWSTHPDRPTFIWWFDGSIHTDNPDKRTMAKAM